MISSAKIDGLDVMIQKQNHPHFSDRLTSKRGSWLALALAVVLMGALFVAFAGAEAPARTGHAPADSESTRVSELMARFPNADQQSVVVVATRTAGGELSATEKAELSAIAQQLNGSDGVQTPQPSSKAGGSMVQFSKDNKAAAITVPIVTGADNTRTAAVIDSLRDEVAKVTPSGLTMQLTGGPAFAADIASAFDGADVTLLLVTIGIVAVLLIATYSSPILWLVPLIVVALADALAGRVTAAAGSYFGLEFDAGIISVLVFGAGTNYALLLISRYREELQNCADDRQALSQAWRKTVAAVLASNVTVVLALLTLTFATIPLTRGLGIPAAIGLMIALAAVLLVLPAALALFGRKIFWPYIPQTGATVHARSIWRSVASFVAGHPLKSLTAGVAVLAVMMLGLGGTTVGLDQIEKFRTPSESAVGLETLSDHFPPGEAQPIFIVTNKDAQNDVLAAIATNDGIVRANPVGVSVDGGLSKIMVTSAYSPGTQASLNQVSELRESVHNVDGAHALVGGEVASEFDARAGNLNDLLIVAPLVLGVSFLVLMFLLRSLLAPALLLLVNVTSAVAAIGAGAWLSRALFGQSALDLQVPILAFLFLVALGIDYTIFLVHRARSEAAHLGTKAGMIESVAHTGSVITSAGIVLAAVFAALGVLPLVTLGQLGLIVGVGVLVDTLVVRTVIVPAIFSLLGDRIWWPGVVDPRREDVRYETRTSTAHAY